MHEVINYFWGESFFLGGGNNFGGGGIIFILFVTTKKHENKLENEYMTTRSFLLY